MHRDTKYINTAYNNNNNNNNNYLPVIPCVKSPCVLLPYLLCYVSFLLVYLTHSSFSLCLSEFNAALSSAYLWTMI